ncbi:hypothetical protein [Pinirhizobacter sp.]|jgi:hypothetical protein|uniref:hypothetical protein n=1 Tax=Pinirhizobacter sp. TaxID=2950432 RepID=UPI002F40C687
MLRTMHRLFLALAACLLVACHQEDAPAPVAVTPPEAALKASVDLLGRGDFAGFWQHALPPADFANLKADWQRRPGLLDEPDRQRLDTSLAELGRDGADKRLWTEISPFVLHFERDYREQMPLTIGIFQSIAMTGIGSATSLTTAQKALAREAVLALGPWAQAAPWGDVAAAHKAIDIAVAAGKDLQFTADGKPADFETSMRNQQLAFNAVVDMAHLYHLDLDAMFASAHTQVLENTEASARVRVMYTLVDRPLSIDIAMVREDGRWYDRDLLESVRSSHNDIVHGLGVDIRAAPLTGAR